MDRFAKIAIVSAASFSIIGIMVAILLNGSSSLSWIIILLECCLVPVSALMVYIWLGKNTGKMINGFKKLEGEERNRLAHYYGMVSSFAVIVMSVAIALMFNGGLYSFAILLISVALFIYPLRYYRGLPPGKRIPLVDSDLRVHCGVLVVVCLLTAMPIALVGAGSDMVQVNLGDDSMHVTAPMFDHTFSYSDIKDLKLEYGFEKGSRVMGYDDGFVSSGTYSNSEFGRYQLASYSSSDPCITFRVGSEHYAINQKTANETKALFDELSSKV